ncbi:MAG: hypothetical protein ACPGJS_19525 [Flammeovirgaceae bacterium]
MALARFMISVNALIAVAVGVYFFVIPAIMGIYYINDQGLKESQIPRLVMDQHEAITPQFESWATDRIMEKAGGEVDENDIAGTEWPLFSAVYYLWTTEALQEDYKKNKAAYDQAPRIYAKEAMKAAVKLLLDPNHAAFVKQKWGKDYLNKENVFYRATAIAGLASYYKLTADARYVDILKARSLSLDQELAASAYGLLNDYPNECYPADVAFAYYAIHQAKNVLNIPADSTTQLGLRGFTVFSDTNQTELQLPPFSLNLTNNPATHTGLPRGSSSAWFMQFAPQLWPTQSKLWMDAFETLFWQRNWTAVGFKEYSEQQPTNWGFDIDGGPILAGHGFTASTFGIGASRLMNRYDLAYPLAAEMISISLPHLNGRLLLPNALSDWTHAPLLGEVAIMYNLSRKATNNTTKRDQGSLPLFVYWANGLCWLLGLIVIWRGIRRTRRGRDLQVAPSYIIIQFVLWLLLILVSFKLVLEYNYLASLGLVIVSRVFPILTLEPKK